MRGLKPNLTQQGFTLMELLVTIGILATMVAIAIPNISGMLASTKYKEAARGVASALQNARALAVSKNLEYRIVFDIDGDTGPPNSYRLEQGSRASGTPSAEWTPVFGDWSRFQAGVVMRGTSDCDATGELTIHFNPTGTSQTGYICIMDGSRKVFRAGVSSSATGRVLIERWDSGSSVWK